MIFALSFPLFANEPSQLALYPAHIEVRLGNVGDSFYRVMMDDEEQPYLPIESSIAYLLEMHGTAFISVVKYTYLKTWHEKPPLSLST